MEEISDIKGCISCSLLEAWFWSPSKLRRATTLEYALTCAESRAAQEIITTDNLVSSLSDRSKDEVVVMYVHLTRS